MLFFICFIILVVCKVFSDLFETFFVPGCGAFWKDGGVWGIGRGVVQVLVMVLANSSGGGKFPFSFSFLWAVLLLTVSSWSFGCVEIGVWSWEVVGGVWGIFNVLLMELCIFFLFNSGLFTTVVFESGVGFGRALMALCMSSNGESGVVLGPKPCVWSVVILYFFVLALGRFGTVFLCTCFIFMYA